MSQVCIGGQFRASAIILALRQLGPTFFVDLGLK